MILPRDSTYFLGKLRRLHLQLRDYLRDQLVTQEPATLAAVTEPREGDTIYRLDEHAEEMLLSYCREWAYEMPFALISEGFAGDGWYILPEGTARDEATFLLMVDPVDGTRPLMYDKRSAWLLTGIAPNLGAQTSLAEITIAMQTELPTSRQNLAYHLWAVRGQGAKSELHDLSNGAVRAMPIQPSRATTLEHGFAGFAKFFPAGKQKLVELETRLYAALMGDIEVENPLIFDDQYTSSGGQLFELMAGHDRFVADVRPLLKYGGSQRPLCAHPYDLCTELIAREAGVIVTDHRGKQLKNRLDIRDEVAWIGYANEALRQLIEPLLLPILKEI